MAEAAKAKKKKTGSKISARKRARQNLKHHARNKTLLSKMRNCIKTLKASLASKNKTEAEKALKAALPVIASMATKGILHKNAAARYTSRLTKQFNSL